MKIQLLRLNGNSHEIVRNYSHSEEVIVQRTRVKVLDEFKKVVAVYLLEGLGPLAWLPIETTGNHEIFAQLYVGEEIPLKKIDDETLEEST